MSAVIHPVPQEQTAVERLTKDLAKGAATLGDDEARFLVDEFYAMQRQRIRSGNQIRALTETKEPHEILGWFSNQSGVLEKQVLRALTKYAEAHPVGQWMLSVRGIGPILTAGLLAHIDITQCPTVGHIWSFAGLDPTKEWKAKTKRPWNAQLKTLCWKIGQSFVKSGVHEDGFYRDIYDQRKAYENAKNDAGEYSEQAAKILKKTPGHKQKATYQEGKLPKGHIDARAQRYTVKLFLAHLHEVWYKHEYKTDPPLPYPIAHLGHVHKIPVPHI